ncbi:hypothetical protein [Priestia megaterium]|mgnify:CR=1 FL=1|uniref:hypothetical protein n=1 Tax=Priestia megaterium TaxID=1404 RepID=UPI002FFE1CAB
MKKIGTLLALSTTLLLGSFSSTQAFAETNQTNSETIKDQLNELESQTDGLEIVDSSELPEGTPTVNFDSVEEFKQAVEEYEKAQMENNNDEINSEMTENLSEENNLEQPKFVTMAASTTKNGLSTIKWMTAERVSYLYKVYYPTFMWIDFSYTYTGSGSTKKFTKIKSVSSQSDNIPSSWHQTDKATNFYDKNKGVSIKITGYYLLGVSIAGYNVGAHFSDSWTKKYHF